MKVTKQHTIFKWKNYSNIKIPEGLRVKYLPDPSGGRYVLDQNIAILFQCRMLTHDATYYGITIHPSQIKEC